MPIYEYQCQSCGHELEKIQRMSDDPLKDCPDCGKAELQRLVSAAGFRLKGAGWYETDFKKGSKKERARIRQQTGGSMLDRKLPGCQAQFIIRRGLTWLRCKPNPGVSKCAHIFVAK